MCAQKTLSMFLLTFYYTEPKSLESMFYNCQNFLNIGISGLLAICLILVLNTLMSNFIQNSTSFTETVIIWKSYFVTYYLLLANKVPVPVAMVLAWCLSDELSSFGTATSLSSKTMASVLKYIVLIFSSKYEFER